MTIRTAYRLLPLAGALAATGLVFGPIGAADAATASASAPGAATLPAATRSAAATPSRATATLRVGQTATIVERDCAGRCGYHWGFITPPQRTLVRAAQKETAVSGAAGRHSFTFTALHAGTATAVLAYFPKRLGRPILGKVAVTLTIKP